MGRSLGIQDIIQLPRLSAIEAAVLGTQLLSVAAEEEKKKALPDSIERSHKRLTAAHAALNERLLPTEQDTQGRRKADRTVDNAWAATFNWLYGWCRLPADVNPFHAESHGLSTLVFADALSFTKLPYRIQWFESQRRLDAIATNGHEATFVKLGGGVFLDHIRNAHAAYGDALGITKPEPETSPEVREKRNDMLAALRDYAARVAAYAEPDVPGSDALSEALLGPLVAWESTLPKDDEPANPGKI